MYRTLSEKFYKDMAESYFHPTRKYPSENVKFLAQLAMLYLWNVPGITLWGKDYDRDFIRKWIINEMTVADLDRAIDEAARREWKMSLRGFAEIIFRSVLYSDSIAKAEVERDFPTSIFKREKESGRQAARLQPHLPAEPTVQGFWSMSQSLKLWVKFSREESELWVKEDKTLSNTAF